MRFSLTDVIANIGPARNALSRYRAACSLCQCWLSQIAMTLATDLAQFTPGAPSHKVTIAPHWHQGRTSYGGFSTVLAYRAASLLAPDLPPLNSTQIAFVGPLAGEVEVRAKILRRGRNTAFVQTEIESEAGIGHTGTFIFAAQRESHVAHESLPRPDFPAIPVEADIRSGPVEFFTSQMQYPDKRLVLGLNTPRLANWHRLTERDGIDPVAELLCIGDALPPSVMGVMTEKGMVSSMNWQVNMLTADPQTEDGWWFLDSVTHHAAHGASSQYMSVWNSEGEPVMTAMQSVALFA